MGEINPDQWPVKKQIAYHRTQLEQAMREAAREAEDAYRSAHPQAGSLRSFSDIRVYRARPAGFSNIPVDMVNLFLISALYRGETNENIVAHLANKWAPYPVSKNIMAKPFTASQAAKIDKLLQKAGRAIDLKVHDTPTKIKKALRADTVTKDASVEYRAFIAFAENHLIVGSARFPVTVHKNGYQRARIGRQWLRCDVLQSMLERS